MLYESNKNYIYRIGKHHALMPRTWVLSLIPLRPYRRLKDPVNGYSPFMLAVTTVAKAALVDPPRRRKREQWLQCTSHLQMQPQSRQREPQLQLHILSARGAKRNRLGVETDRNLFLPKYSAEYLTEYSAETE